MKSIDNTEERVSVSWPFRFFQLFEPCFRRSHEFCCRSLSCSHRTHSAQRDPSLLACGGKRGTSRRVRRSGRVWRRSGNRNCRIVLKRFGRHHSIGIRKFQLSFVALALVTWLTAFSFQVRWCDWRSVIVIQMNCAYRGCIGWARDSKSGATLRLTRVPCLPERGA